MKLKKEDLKRIIREEVDSHLSGPELESQGPREESVQGLDVPNESMYPQLLEQFAAVLQDAFGPNVNVYQELINIAEFDATGGKRIPYREGKTKVSKAGQDRVSKKIGYLIGKENMDQDQAAAIAYSMEERGELKKGGKHSVE